MPTILSTSIFNVIAECLRRTRNEMNNNSLINKGVESLFTIWKMSPCIKKYRFNALQNPYNPRKNPPNRQTKSN